MKHYPFFITEILLLAIFLAIIPVAVFYNGPVSYGAAIVAAVIFAVVSVTDYNRYKEFEMSVKTIKGISSWDTDFFSLGALRFDYKGETIRYSSCIGTGSSNYIPVTYNIKLENNSDIAFEVIPGGKWLGEFSAKGNRKFLDTLKQQITAFNKKYAIKRISNREGMLEMGVQLDFIANQPPPPDKLEDMSHFLEEFLEFGYNINNKLKRA